MDMKKAKKKPKKYNHVRIDRREVHCYAEETIDYILELARGCKYCYPEDENERGFNRGIDRVIRMIKELEVFVNDNPDSDDDE